MKIQVVFFLFFCFSAFSQDLETENLKLKQQVSDLETQLFNINRLVENYIDGELNKGSFLEIYNQNEDLTIQNENLKNQNDNLLSQLEKTKIELNKSVNDYESTYNKNSELVSKINEANSLISDYTSKLKSKSQKIDVLDSNNKTLKSKISDLNSELSQTKELHESNIDKLTSKHNSILSQSKVKQKAKINELKSEHNSYVETLSDKIKLQETSSFLQKNKIDSLISLNKDLGALNESLENEFLEQEAISNQFAKSFSDLLYKNNKICKLFKIADSDIFESKEKYRVYLGEFDLPLKSVYLEDLVCLPNLNNKFFCYSGKFNNETKALKHNNIMLGAGYKSELIKF